MHLWTAVAAAAVRPNIGEKPVEQRVCSVTQTPHSPRFSLPLRVTCSRCVHCRDDVLLPTVYRGWQHR